MNVELFNQEFERISGQLKSYILRMTASLPDAEDIVQETYIKGLEKRETFRGASSIKTWLFTIASNLAKDHFRVKKRWTEDITDHGREAAKNSKQFMAEALEINATSPYGQFEVKEHIAFCFTCISKSLPLSNSFVFSSKKFTILKCQKSRRS